MCAFVARYSYTMIPSSRKVGKELFKILIEQGRYCASPSFGARVINDKSLKLAKFSVVVAKKLEKSAVMRNTTKRRFYSLLRPFLGTVRPGTICAFFIKKKIGRADLPALALEIQAFLNKSKLL